MQRLLFHLDQPIWICEYLRGYEMPHTLRTAIVRALFDYQQILLERNTTMAKRQASNWSDITFVSWQLDNQQKADFEKWEKAARDEVELYLRQFVDTGHKISMSFDEGHDCYICSVTCRDTGSANENHCVTSRAECVITATLIAAYKVFVVAEDVPWADLARNSRWG